MIKKHSKMLFAACAGAGLLFLTATAFAADGGEHLNVQEPPRPEYLSKPGEAFQLPPVEASPELSPPDETSAEIEVKQVVFRGNSVFPAGNLEAIASSYVGRIISVAELEELRQKLTRHYIDRGYINSGVLLASGAADGVIVFQVVEGRLAAIRLQGMERLNENYVARRLAKDMDGPFNIDTLRERYQLLLGDPLIQRMNARLLPGSQPGEAVLDVDVVRARPWQLTAFINNYRPPSIGSEANGLSGWLRNLTGQGDLLETSIQSSLHAESDVSFSFAWHMPLNYYGTQLSIELNHGVSSVIEEPMRTLDIKSTLDSRDIGLSQPLLETLAQKLVFGVNRVSRENDTSLLGTPFSFNPGVPNGVTKEDLWRYWLEYTHRSETQVLALRSTFTSGGNNLSDVVGLPATNTVKFNRQYSIWLGQIQYARQVMDNGAQIVLRGAIQQTEDRLLALDGMSIGGVNTVRGYLENQLVRDKGEVINFEFEYPLAGNNPKEPNTAIIPFYDYGQGQNIGDAATTISSCGLTTRIRWGNFKVDVAVAKQLEPISGNGSSLQGQGIHFQLFYGLY